MIKKYLASKSMCMSALVSFMFKINDTPVMGITQTPIYTCK